MMIRLKCAFTKYASAGALYLMLGMAALPGCPRADQPRSPVIDSNGHPAAPPPTDATTKPADTPPEPATPEPEPPPPPDRRVEVRVASAQEPQRGWLKIAALREGAPAANATGRCKDNYRIEIETEDVQEFTIDLDDLNIDWSRRVVLRIDGSTTELRKRDDPILRLRRSSGGAWDVID